MEDDDNNNDDDDDSDDGNYDNKKDNDGRDIREFNINNASRRETTRRTLKYMWKSEREGARNSSLMKERVEQVQISAHTGVTHATIIALISKRASNNALPRIDLTAVSRIGNVRGGKVEYIWRPRCKVGAIV